jgi:hypothetical protein
MGREWRISSWVRPRTWLLDSYDGPSSDDFRYRILLLIELSCDTSSVPNKQTNKLPHCEARKTKIDGVWWSHGFRQATNRGSEGVGGGWCCIKPRFVLCLHVWHYGLWTTTATSESYDHGRQRRVSRNEWWVSADCWRRLLRVSSDEWWWVSGMTRATTATSERWWMVRSGMTVRDDCDEWVVMTVGNYSDEWVVMNGEWVMTVGGNFDVMNGDE